MPRVTVELTDKEIKEIIYKTNKSVAEGIKELILQNIDKLSLTEEQLRELITQVVFSHSKHLISEIRELVEKASQNPKEITKLSEELSTLKTKVHNLGVALAKAHSELRKEIEDKDTNIKVFVAKRCKELESITARKLKEIEKKTNAEETKRQAEAAAYWTAKLMLTVGELLGRVKKIEEALIPVVQRFKRECVKSHYPIPDRKSEEKEFSQ